MKCWFIEFDENGKKTKGFWVRGYGFKEKGILGISVKVPTDLNPTKSRYREIYLSIKLLKKEIKRIEKAGRYQSKERERCRM